MMTGWRGRRAQAKQGDPAGPGGSGNAANLDGGTGARLRRMVPADLADVMALEHELFPDDPWTDQMFAEEVAQPPDSRLYLIAEADTARAGEPVVAGYAGMMFVPGGVQADVLTIAVARSFWGRGIGSALLSALIQAARDRGCTEVFLEVRKDNPRARGLYLRRGFEEIGVRRGYYQPSGMDAIVMRKDLLR
jgi:ribosomal-protein-alanine N-acetyltransferase